MQLQAHAELVDEVEPLLYLHLRRAPIGRGWREQHLHRAHLEVVAIVKRRRSGLDARREREQIGAAFGRCRCCRSEGSLRTDVLDLLRLHHGGHPDRTHVEHQHARRGVVQVLGEQQSRCRKANIEGGGLVPCEQRAERLLAPARERLRHRVAHDLREGRALRLARHREEVVDAAEQCGVVHKLERRGDEQRELGVLRAVRRPLLITEAPLRRPLAPRRRRRRRHHRRRHRARRFACRRRGAHERMTQGTRHRAEVVHFDRVQAALAA